MDADAIDSGVFKISYEHPSQYGARDSWRCGTHNLRRAESKEAIVASRSLRRPFDYGLRPSAQGAPLG